MLKIVNHFWFNPATELILFNTKIMIYSLKLTCVRNTLSDNPLAFMLQKFSIHNKIIHSTKEL